MLVGVVATDQTGLIGYNSRDGSGYRARLPWHAPEDTRFFRELTQGHPVVLGRRTAESLGRWLRNRQHVVLTRDPGRKLPDWPVPPDSTVAVCDERHLLDLAESSTTFFVAGGAEVYALTRHLMDHLYVTVINDIVSVSELPVYTDVHRGWPQAEVVARAELDVVGWTRYRLSK